MVREFNRRDVLGSFGGAALAGLAGCISQSGGDESFEARLGVLLPLTGDLASVGKPIRDGAILPKNVIESGDAPITIDQRVEDSQTDPQAAVSTAEDLVNAGYPMITGPASSGVNMQVTQESLIPNGVVGCSPSSTSPNVTTLDDDDLIFRTAPSDALQGQVMAQVGSENLESNSASALYVNNDYGQALFESFNGAYEDRGATVETGVAFRKEKDSYTTELGEAMESDPDMLVVIGYPASGIQIFRDFYSEYSTDTDILVTDGLQSGDLPGNVGEEMSNVYGTAPLPSGPGNDAFVQQYEDEYDRSPGVFNAHAYDASAVLLLAATRAGENDGDTIKEEMRTVANPGDDSGTEISPANLIEGIELASQGEPINYVGASSSVDFDENGDMKAVSYSFWRFDTSVDGNIEQVSTVEFGGS
ncbi:MAG: ABC transporter substrate-binding protein [Halolamina sp.]|uniref:ABC transporter substrate-binding protein n=1 Tax=Halolamina sp. TaxID=1940283 RepID=UPI002FC27DEF